MEDRLEGANEMGGRRGNISGLRKSAPTNSGSVEVGANEMGCRRGNITGVQKSVQIHRRSVGESVYGMGTITGLVYTFSLNKMQP